MIVETQKLNTGTQEGYNYSEQAEAALGELVFGQGCEVTTGIDSRYDLLTPNNKKIEIKFTNAKTIFIETSYADGTPSGLAVSEADYYLIVQKGFYQNQDIGKIKLISTDALRNVRYSCQLTSYPPSYNSPGSCGFRLGQELGQKDGWLGSIRFNNGYDLSGFTVKRPLLKQVRNF